MRLITLIIFLLTAQIAAANFMFHVFQAPYIGPLFFWPGIVLILFLESWLLWFLCDNFFFWQALLMIIIANLISWFFGMATAPIFPSGWERMEGNGPFTMGDDFNFFMYISFPVAYVLTVIIEGGCLWLTNRFVAAITIPQPFLQSLKINTASYVLIFMGLLYYF